MRRVLPILFALIGVLLVRVGEAQASRTLRIWTMPVGITTCEICNHKKDGLDCPWCPWHPCNCLLGGFTAADGNDYDARYYPGVRM